MYHPYLREGVVMSPHAQKLFDEGIFAFSAGMGFLDNPYLELTDLTKARIWIDGYVAAFISWRASRHPAPPAIEGRGL